jgi:hypothetical protein
MVTYKSSVLDPDTDKFQIQMSQLIWIRIEITDPDSDVPKSSPIRVKMKNFTFEEFSVGRRLLL